MPKARRASVSFRSPLFLLFLHSVGIKRTRKRGIRKSWRDRGIRTTVEEPRERQKISQVKEGAGYVAGERERGLYS